MYIFKVIVCGGRTFSDKELLFKALTQYKDSNIGMFFVIHGGASGADSLADQWARENGVPCAVLKAQWDKYGKKAGHIRNKWMALLKPNLVIAFPGGRGTENMIDTAKLYSIDVERIDFEHTFS